MPTFSGDFFSECGPYLFGRPLRSWGFFLPPYRLISPSEKLPRSRPFLFTLDLVDCFSAGFSGVHRSAPFDR